MASSYWIKAYYEILDDPKMGRLPDHIWRRAIEFFLLAGEAGDGGYLPSVSDMAWRLRTTDDDILECLGVLQTADIVSETDNGWIVTHFAERQDASSNADRQARYRERKQKRDYYSNEPSNDGVTKRNTDKDKEEDKDKDKKKIPLPRPEIFSIYEHEIGALTSTIADELLSASDDYPDGWIADALKESARQNKRSWAYAKAILKRRKADGGRVEKKPATRTLRGPNDELIEVEV